MNQSSARSVDSSQRGSQKMSDNRGFRIAWLSVAVMAVFSLLLIVAAHGVAAAAVQKHGVAPSPVKRAKPKIGGKEYHLTLSSGGVERSFLVHVSPEATENKPLLIMLHGAGGDGVQAERQTGWSRKADKEDFVVVYPDALPANPHHAASFRENPRFWDDGSERGRTTRGAIDDVAFIEAVIDDVGRRYPIDPKRIYVTGFSSGASMTFHLAASPLAERIAAAAPVAGHFFDAGKENAVRPTPLLLVYGSLDPLNPMAGGVVHMPWGGTERRPPVEETVAAWAKFVGCPAEGVVLSHKSGVKRVAYGPGKEGAEFLFWTIEGMGHRWPGSQADVLPDRMMGPKSDKLNGVDSIWTFLSRHTLSVRAEAP
jgi:polyhydroxybutyrate depolymerase